MEVVEKVAESVKTPSGVGIRGTDEFEVIDDEDGMAVNWAVAGDGVKMGGCESGCSAGVDAVGRGRVTYSVTVVEMWIVVMESCSASDGTGTKAPGEFDSNGGCLTDVGFKPPRSLSGDGEGSKPHGRVTVDS